MARKNKFDRATYNRDWSLRTLYGITSEQYSVMVKAVNGLCVICGLPPKDDKLVVDHDHETGIIRGIICRRCNLGLGHFNDDPALIARALEYLLKDRNDNSA